MASKPYVASTSTVTADQPVVTRHVITKTVQAAALLAPPILLVRAAFKRTFTLNRFLRGQAIASFLIAPPLGTAMVYGRLRNVDEEGIADRAYRIRMNSTQRQCDDYATVGAVLGSLVTTTLFLKRANTVYTVLGGASLGIAGGVLTHIARNTRSALGPNAMVEELKDAYPGKAILEDGEEGVKDALKGVEAPSRRV